MDEMALIQCPFCGHRTMIEVDASMSDQDYTEDCEQCCRPMHVKLHCVSGSIRDMAVDTE